MNSTLSAVEPQYKCGENCCVYTGSGEVCPRRPTKQVRVLTRILSRIVQRVTVTDLHRRGVFNFIQSETSLDFFVRKMKFLKFSSHSTICSTRHEKTQIRCSVIICQTGWEAASGAPAAVETADCRATGISISSHCSRQCSWIIVKY